MFEGKNNDGSYSNFKQRYKKWAFLVHAPFKIHNKCCDIMKKKPIKKFEKESGLKAIIGTMAVESALRKNAWLKTGCNAYETKRPQSKPMSFWTEQDVLEYIKENNIIIPSVYGSIKGKNNKLYTTGEQRTGCIFCPIGCHLGKENKYKRLRETHPMIYDYCMNQLGLKEVLEYIGNHLGKELF